MHPLEFNEMGQCNKCDVCFVLVITCVYINKRKESVDGEEKFSGIIDDSLDDI
jgi:hypothetical protein